MPGAKRCGKSHAALQVLHQVLHLRCESCRCESLLCAGMQTLRRGLPLLSVSYLRSRFRLATERQPVTACRIMEPTLVVCGSKVHALAKRLNSTLAEHILGFAVADGIMSEAHPDAQPNACQKCRAAAIVDMSDPRVWLAWFSRFSCKRERRVELEWHLERGGRRPRSGRFRIKLELHLG